MGRPIKIDRPLIEKLIRAGETNRDIALRAQVNIKSVCRARLRIDEPFKRKKEKVIALIKSGQRDRLEIARVAQVTVGYVAQIFSRCGFSRRRAAL